jgi:hypothetical protein
MAALTDDVLRRCFSYLTVAERVQAERVSRGWQRVLANWTDINALSLSNESLTLANQRESFDCQPRFSDKKRVKYWQVGLLI